MSEDGLTELGREIFDCLSQKKTRDHKCCIRASTGVIHLICSCRAVVSLALSFQLTNHSFHMLDNLRLH